MKLNIRLPLQGRHCTPPPSTLQKKRLPLSRSSSEYAVAAAAFDAQQSSFVTPCDNNSLQRPLLMEDQHIPPVTYLR